MAERSAGSRPPRWRRCRRAAAAAAAMLLLAGCGGGGEPIPAEDAVEYYALVSTDVLTALEAVRPLGWEQRAQEILDPGAEDCRYQAGIWETEDPLYEEPGQGRDWEPWREALDPVLEEHGFAPLGREQRSGALYSLESTGEHGARLILTDQGTLRITDIRVDADPCEDATLGL